MAAVGNCAGHELLGLVLSAGKGAELEAALFQEATGGGGLEFAFQAIVAASSDGLTGAGAGSDARLVMAAIAASSSPVYQQPIGMAAKAQATIKEAIHTAQQL